MENTSTAKISYIHIKRVNKPVGHFCKDVIAVYFSTEILPVYLWYSKSPASVGALI